MIMKLGCLTTLLNKIAADKIKKKNIVPKLYIMVVRKLTVFGFYISVRIDLVNGQSETSAIFLLLKSLLEGGV